VSPISRGGAFVPSDPEVEELINETISPWEERGGGGIPREDWIARLEKLSIEQLAHVAIGIHDYDEIVHPRRPHALQALRTVVDAKLAAQTHDLMKKLDAATLKLQSVAIVVRVVGVLVMLAQLVMACLVARASGTFRS
jgi:hypothetical protein